MEHIQWSAKWMQRLRCQQLQSRVRSADLDSVIMTFAMTKALFCSWQGTCSWIDRWNGTHQQVVTNAVCKFRHGVCIQWSNEQNVRPPSQFYVQHGILHFLPSLKGVVELQHIWSESQSESKQDATNCCCRMLKAVSCVQTTLSCDCLGLRSISLNKRTLKFLIWTFRWGEREKKTVWGIIVWPAKCCCTCQHCLPVKNPPTCHSSQSLYSGASLGISLWSKKWRACSVLTTFTLTWNETSTFISERNTMIIAHRVLCHHENLEYWANDVIFLTRRTFILLSSSFCTIVGILIAATLPVQPINTLHLSGVEKSFLVSVMVREGIPQRNDVTGKRKQAPDSVQFNRIWINKRVRDSF